MKRKAQTELSAQEMAMEIANRYLHGTPVEQRVILSCFTDEEKEVFLNFIRIFKLYSDQAYYDAVKTAVLQQIEKEAEMKCRGK